MIYVSVIDVISLTSLIDRVAYLLTDLAGFLQVF